MWGEEQAIWSNQKMSLKNPSASFSVICASALRYAGAETTLHEILAAESALAGMRAERQGTEARHGLIAAPEHAVVGPAGQRGADGLVMLVGDEAVSGGQFRVVLH